MGILGISINLMRRPERKVSQGKLVSTLGLDKHIWLEARDGMELARSGGRLRHLNNGVVRLTWTEPGGENRISCTARHGNAFVNGLTNAWGMFGATQSHIAALEVAHEHLTMGTYDYCLIMEDDCVNQSTCVDMQKFLLTTIRTMNSLRPRWQTLQLGSLPVGRHRPSSMRRVVASGDTDIRVAERDYLAHAYLIRLDACAPLLAYLRKGMTPDGALVALQGCNARRAMQLNFTLDPPILSQLQADSDTCLAGTWPQAFKRLKKYRGRRPSRGRITKPALRGMRRALGSSGGKVSAGNGSSASSIKRKITKLRRALSCGSARGSSCSGYCSSYTAKQHGISHSVWKREFAKSR